jgi:hypothetical protein
VLLVVQIVFQTACRMHLKPCNIILQYTGIRRTHMRCEVEIAVFLDLLWTFSVFFGSVVRRCKLHFSQTWLSLLLRGANINLRKLAWDTKQ